MAEAVAHSATLGVPRTADVSDFLLHPHLFSSFPAKTTQPVDLEGPLLKLRSYNGSVKEDAVASELIRQLQRRRQEAVAALEAAYQTPEQQRQGGTIAGSSGNTAGSGDTLVAATSSYIEVLYAMLSDSQTNTGRGSLDSPRHSFDLPRFNGLTGNSKLRTAVHFTWTDCLLAPGSFTLQDAVYELASLLTAVAVVRIGGAVALCRTGEVRTFLSVEVYKLMREAAGLFRALHSSALPLLGLSPSLDCSTQVVSALELHCLAEAQSITVLRAFKKGNQPGLVAGLAADTSQLYKSASLILDGCVYACATGGHGNKLRAYLRYKAAVFKAYQMVFAARVHLASKQAGAALRCCKEAQREAAAALVAATEYDAAAPQTPKDERANFDEELSTCMRDTMAAAERDNKAYMQHVPAQVPELPAAQRLVAVSPWTWPPPAPLLLDNRVEHCFVDAAKGQTAPASASVIPGTFDGTAKDQEGPAAGNGQAAADSGSANSSSNNGSEWWRWLLVFIAAPVLVVISLVGAIVWLVLLPLKCLCCPIGCAAQLAWDCVEWLMKAPFRAILWASGKPWRPDVQQRPDAPPRLEAEQQKQGAAAV